MAATHGLFVPMRIVARLFDGVRSTYVYRLKVPALLRKTQMSTNQIESMFSLVR
jgi:hypothetical protein